jgi:flagellar motor switch protein FliN/FliY
MAEPAKNPADQMIQAQEDVVKTSQRFSGGADMDLDSIEDVPVEVTVVLGETTITVDELLKMGKGAIVELDRKVGEPVELYVNERCVAKGEIVVVDNKIGITMTEIIKNDNKE